MNIKANAELKTLRNTLVKGMLDNRVGGAKYTKAHVERCRCLLEEHLVAISRAPDRNAAKECVKATVMKLNQLNEEAGYELIETLEREEVCKYIIRAGALARFNAEEEDVTEEWRDW